MSAKEMFEELGYEEENDKNYIEYTKYMKNIKQYAYIYFDLEEKVILPTMEYSSSYALEIDMNLLKAINKQIEELGW